MPYPDHLSEVELDKHIKSIILEPQRIGAIAPGLGPQMIHDAEFKAWVDMVTEGLWMQIQTEVYRTKLATGTHEVPFSKRVHVNNVAMALAMVPGAIVCVALLYAFGAGIFSIFGLLPLIAGVVGLVTSLESTVQGTAKVHVEEWAYWPENQKRLPKDTFLGRPHIAHWWDYELEFEPGDAGMVPYCPEENDG